MTCTHCNYIVASYAHLPDWKGWDWIAAKDGEPIPRWPWPQQEIMDCICGCHDTWKQGCPA